MKRFISVPVIIILLLTLMPVCAMASAQSVQVTLPTFKVTLNDTPVDSRNREYPLIVYKGITYFPMTYYDCRYLGLQTEWSSQTGLEINNTGISGLYRTYNRNSINNRSYTATIVDSPVRLNGKYIDNAKEEYPLLLFRGMTYFPLTWRFAVDEFGWEYAFSMSDGLVIRSDNPAIKKIDIQIPANIPPELFMFTIAGGTCFSLGENGIIYMENLWFPKDKSALFQLPSATMGDGFVRGNLYKEYGNVYLRYSTGSSPIGMRNVIVWLKFNGTWEEIANGNFTQKNYGNVLVKVEQYVPPTVNNLFIKYWGEELTNVGNPDFLYGWTRSGNGYGPSSDLYMIGDDIYVLAVENPRNDSTSTTGLYKVNVKTNDTVRFVADPVKHFIIKGDFFYYINEADSRIYKMPLSGGISTALTPPVNTGTVVTDFEILSSGEVYYIARTGEKALLFRTGEPESLNSGAYCQYIQKSDNDYYLGASFKSDDVKSCRLMVFDPEGHVLFKSSDEATAIDFDGGRFYYVEASLRQIGEANLPMPPRP